jgi:hypothetical protein
MKAFLKWIVLNPATFKSYLLAILPLVGKGILAATGKMPDMGQWNDFIETGVNVLVGCLTTYGIGGVIVHTARGPQLSAADQTVAIVAALAPASVPVAAETMRNIEAEVALHPPAPGVVFPGPNPGPHDLANPRK